MDQPKSSLIVAVDKTYGIGVGNRLPWKSKADMHFFRKMTAGSVCIMGRNTYESIRAVSKTSDILPGRMCVVVSSAFNDPIPVDPQNRETHTAHSVENSYLGHTYGCDSVERGYLFAVETIRKRNQRGIFFIGGRSIYQQCVPYIQTAYVNMILDDYQCDTFFPQEILDDFTLSPNHEKLAENLLAFTYHKKKGQQ